MVSRCAARVRHWLAAFAVFVPAAAGAQPASPPTPGSGRFPDFKAEFRPPAEEYPGPLFRLSQGYPAAEPSLDEDPELKALLDLPFDRENDRWRAYLEAVRDYCVEGNTDVDWQGQDNRVRTWYHVPWQHWGHKAREGIHGLTREASAEPFQLAAEQTEPHDTYAVALYNKPGGFTIGQVWKNESKPDPNKARFPVGTVVVKILFTQADERQVPYLTNPVSWAAYVRNPKDKSKRKVQTLRLIQMDVMVREDDDGDAPFGWVFGTYCYNGALNNPNLWDNLVPVGIQWGNDPAVRPKSGNGFAQLPVTATTWNEGLKETIVNPSPDLPKQHLGWDGRLNGPVDNFWSSCMSCHATAQYPLAEQHPSFEAHFKFDPDQPEQWKHWFRNLPCGEVFDEDVEGGRPVSTDYSLQLAMGIDFFHEAVEWQENVGGGFFTGRTPEDVEDRDALSEPEGESDGSGI